MRISDWSSDVCSSDLQQVLSSEIELGDAPGRRHAKHHIERDCNGRCQQGQLDGSHRIGLDNGRRIGIPAFTQCLGKNGQQGRSEEHTSELQSLMRISYAVFCLKKTKTNSLLNNT